MSKRVRNGESSPWWSPHVHADRRPTLLQRGRIKTAFRGHFEAEGFTEVECGALAVSPGNEAHLHALRTSLLTAGGDVQPLYLHTSPRICRQETAGGRRNQNLRFRPRLSQPRARSLARS